MKAEDEERTITTKSSIKKSTSNNIAGGTNIVETKNKNNKLLKKKNGCQTFVSSLFLFGFLFFCRLPPTSGQYQVYRQDPFAMLSGTLQVIIAFLFYSRFLHLPFIPSFFHLLISFQILFYSFNGNIFSKVFISCLFYWYFIQTYQKAACDGQAINLDCPSGTKIAIQLVQYGRSAPSSEVNTIVRHKTI